jgi:ElaB/YqjD/DUF883 family membrane-anchored ribosome-binding protein
MLGITSIDKRTALDDAREQTDAAIADVAATGAIVADKADAVAGSAREALAEMRRIVDAFAASTGEKVEEAATAVGATGAETARRFGVLVDDARLLGRDGLDRVAEKVAERPFAALAVAAGVGIALGLLTRPGDGR